MTDLQKLRARALSECRLPASGASGEQRFVADMVARSRQATPAPLSAKQADWLTKLAWRHREQMPRELVPAQNPYELNPPVTPKHKFKCDDCQHVRWFEPTDDPTSSSGSCPNCGGKHWNIYDPNGDKIE